MFRFAFIVLLALLQFTHASIDISKYSKILLEFQSDDAILQTKDSYPEERGPTFIGDLVAGQRQADEMIFRRVIELSNPTDSVQSTALSVSITSGSIHYVSLKNAPGSYAVVCGNPNALGGKKMSFNVRMPSNSQGTLTLLIAANS